MISLRDDLTPYLMLMRCLVTAHGAPPHAARVLEAIKKVGLEAEIFDRRQQYLEETRMPAHDTALVYIEGDKNRPVRKKVLRVTGQHVVLAWHETRTPEHHFDRSNGYSLERPHNNDPKFRHRIDSDELALLQQTKAGLTG